jgi:hypothetical protein
MKGHPERKAAIEQVASSFRTFRDADDPNSIVIVAEDVNLDKFGAIVSDPEVQAQMDKHTVVQPVLVSVEVDV